ncbi:hypothetical protein KY334_01585, partial [Candidatus Woesearchaeota archaeon]|nr:hypothetical protein [Candidatus Woesearchaeota archaeon]
VIDKVVLASGAVMIVVGVGLTVSGFGSAIGVPLAAAGFALDAASITNECWIENGGGRNWNGCYLDVGVTIGSFGIGRWIIGPLFKKLGTHLAVKRIVQNLDELGEHIPHRVLNDVLRNSDDAGELAIRLSKGVDALKSKNIPLEDLFKQSSRSIDDVKRLNIILNIGDLFTRNSEFAEKALMGMSRYNNLEKMVLLSRINEIDTAFNLGSGYIEEIRFVSYLPEGTLGRTLEGVIEINVKANFDEIVGNVISHEYGHNYITKKLGGKQIWDFMGNPAGSRQYLESFDEFLTEKTARDIFDLHIHSDLLKNADDVSKFRFYYLEIFSSPDPAKRLSVANKMVEMLAVSKYHDPLRYDFMLDALEDGTELSHKIIYASEAYADAANIITETNKRQILTGIQNHVMDIEEITKRIIVRNE